MTHRLRQALGLAFGLAVILGNTIGAGILRAPGEVATYLPTTGWFMLAWGIGGAYALLGALSIAELGTMMPQSGGQYVYAKRALGAYAGFVVGWSDGVSTCGSTAFIAMVMGEYASAFWPRLAGHDTGIAAAVTIAFAAVQWRGIAWGSRVQNLTSLLKALVFVALIGACFALGHKPATSVATVNSTRPFFLSLILALQAIIYTYDGWTGVIYFSEEVREPARDIPRALFGGVLAIIAIYLLVNLAFLTVLPVSKIASDPFVAGTVAQVLWGARGTRILQVLVLLSMLSSINANTLMASRVLFGMSRDALFSDKVVNVNAGGTPTLALFISTLITLFFILTGTFNQVLAVLAFFFVTNYALSFLSVLVLRRTELQTPRPHRTWCYPFTTGLALLGSLTFLLGAVISDRRNSLYALALLAISYPVFFLLRRKI
ncbi:MAG: APC family permease [Blastocatellia bacterium]